jgi:uncharacterized protein involved in exopolysaccharide biosynthesis
MHAYQPSANHSGIGIHDIFHALKRRRVMVLSLSICGILLASLVHFSRKPVYASEAKLLVRYVLERGVVDPYEARQNPGANKADQVIQTEIEILTSMDLALEVARDVGVGKISPGLEGESGLESAAAELLGNLKVVVGQSNNVLLVKYSHEDREVTKAVLHKLMDAYFQKHLLIHRSAAAFDLIAIQTNEVKEKLNKTEEKLNKLRTESGITSLGEATGTLANQRASTNDELIKVRAEYAEQQAKIESLRQKPAEDNSRASMPSNSSDPASGITPSVFAEYRVNLEMLDFLRKRDIELRIKFKPGNRLLELNRSQIAQCESKRQALVAAYPMLTTEIKDDSNNPMWSQSLERARLASYAAKIKVFENHLKEISRQFSEQYAVGSRIEELERQRQMEDAEYRNLEANLKNAKVDQTLDPSRMPNITIVQQPTEPFRYYDERENKIIMGLAGGGMSLGLGLALLMELLLDKRVKRPDEIERKLSIPLMSCIPYLRNSGGGFLTFGGTPLLGNGDDLVLPDDPDADHAKHSILPYAETIRDRVIFDFESNRITHKPKLIAVTSLSSGSGTSTIAAGLAKSFSEIPGAKVLCVDLSAFDSAGDGKNDGRKWPLNRALQMAASPSFAHNERSLFHASGDTEEGADARGINAVQFSRMLPDMQDSPYDYIIFEMPSVEKSGRTLTMAALMDKVILVLDAENTVKDMLVWTYSELTKGKADVSCVFNKASSDVPSWLCAN